MPSPPKMITLFLKRSLNNVCEAKFAYKRVELHNEVKSDVFFNFVKLFCKHQGFPQRRRQFFGGITMFIAVHLPIREGGFVDRCSGRKWHENHDIMLHHAKNRNFPIMIEVRTATYDHTNLTPTLQMFFIVSRLCSNTF